VNLLYRVIKAAMNRFSTALKEDLIGAGLLTVVLFHPFFARQDKPVWKACEEGAAALAIMLAYIFWRAIIVVWREITSIPPISEVESPVYAPDQKKIRYTLQNERPTRFRLILVGIGAMASAILMAAVLWVHTVVGAELSAPESKEVIIAPSEQYATDDHVNAEKSQGTLDVPSFLLPPQSPVSIAPDKLSFRDRIGTTSAPQIITVVNRGGVRKIISIKLAGDFSQTSDCPPELSVGDSCSIAVSFTPTKAGFVSGSIEIMLTDPFPVEPPGIEIIRLSGYGT
jgi:hypothetical protein